MSDTEQTLREVSPVGGAGGEQGWVYFIGCKDRWPIKIGWSQWRPDLRLGQIQTCFPYELELLAAAAGVVPDERSLHRFFKPSRTRANGEWFERTLELMALIGALRGHKAEPPAECAWLLERTKWTGPVAVVPVAQPVTSPPPKPERDWEMVRARGRRLRAIIDAMPKVVP